MDSHPQKSHIENMKDFKQRYPPIQVEVKTMFGNLITLKIPPNYTVESLKEKIQNKGGSIRK